MTNPLDLTGSRILPLVLALTPDAVQALTAEGVTVPEPAQVRLLLTEATMRERARYDADQKPGGATHTDPQWFTKLLMRRAEPGTELRVMQELVRDFGPTDIAMLTHAYLVGVVSDPKLTAQAMQMTLTGTSNGLLAALGSAALSPSSPTSTA